MCVCVCGWGEVGGMRRECVFGDQGCVVKCVCVCVYDDGWDVLGR